MLKVTVLQTPLEEEINMYLQVLDYTLRVSNCVTTVAEPNCYDVSSLWRCIASVTFLSRTINSNKCQRFIK